MHRLWIAIVGQAVLLTGEIAFGQAAAASPPGYEPLSYDYGAPHGYRTLPAYGPPPRYALPSYVYGPPPHYGPPQYSPLRAHVALPCGYGSPRGYGPRTEYGPAPPGYGPLPHAYGSPPGYGPNPEYSLPLHIYESPPYAIPGDRTARLNAWNKIADSLADALLEARQASSHDYSKFIQQWAHATRPR